MANLGWEQYKLMKPLDLLCYWSLFVTTISVLVAAFHFTSIPSSREDHSERKNVLLAVLVMSAILFLTSIAYEILCTRGKTRNDRRRPIDIVMHIITIPAIIALMVGTVLLFIQIDKITWPNTKLELKKCRVLAAVNSDRTDTVPEFEKSKGYCAILNQYPEVGSMTLCDKIYVARRSPTYRFKNDKRYCVTTDQFAGNIAGGVMALITVLSQAFLQWMIFDRMKRGMQSVGGREKAGQMSGQVHTITIL